MSLGGFMRGVGVIELLARFYIHYVYSDEQVVSPLTVEYE